MRPPPGALDAAPPRGAGVGPITCAPPTRTHRAHAPTPTWFCARADGTRHGAFVMQFPDGSAEITGSYADGQLDGAWERRHPSGSVAETGRYLAGHKHGRWRQISTGGGVLGEYELAHGTGIERQWLDDGALYRARSLVASVPHGLDEVFGADGAVLGSARYVDGTLAGPHTFGTRDTLRFEESFTGGVRHGARKIWVSSTLVADEAYDSRGRLDGPYTLWRRPRVPRARGQFTHGVRTGAWAWFDRAGNKERGGAYVAGKREGTWQAWWERTLVMRGGYQHGKPHGEHVHFDRKGRELGRFALQQGTGTMLTFHDNGNVSSRQAMRSGHASGVFEELTRAGKVVVAGRYLDNHKHGTWKEWTAARVPRLEQTWTRGQLDGPIRKYVDGVLAMEATYVAGKASGPYAEYRAGKPAVTGAFVDDLKHGTWTTYDAAGNAVLTATYVRGVLAGPWRQLRDGGTVEGTMLDGRRVGTWTRTDRAGSVTRQSYDEPSD